MITSWRWPCREPRMETFASTASTLRTVGQRQSRRQHRTRPRTARHAIPPETARNVRGHSRRRTARAAASMPVLRRPHDGHRDLRARLRAEAPPHTGSGGAQDRHLMMPSLPIDDRHPARQSCRLSTGSSHACRWPPDCPAIAPTISAHNPSSARSPLQPRPCLQAKSSHQPLRSHILLPDPAAKSP